MTDGIPNLRALPGPPKARDVLSIENAFRAHAAYLGRVCLRVLGRRDEVDDVVQQVFLEAQGRIEKLRHPEALRPWLVTLTVRISRRKLRFRKLRYFLHLDDVPDYEEMVDRSASPEDRTQLARLFEVLDRIPVERRLAWTLRYIEGEKLERVALLCDCSLATAKRRIEAAQQALQEVFVDD
jgi:RNA polymerase sigma-70 factor, ECF subfamily